MVEIENNTNNAKVQKSKKPKKVSNERKIIDMLTTNNGQQYKDIKKMSGDELTVLQEILRDETKKTQAVIDVHKIALGGEISEKAFYVAENTKAYKKEKFNAETDTKTEVNKKGEVVHRVKFFSPDAVQSKKAKKKNITEDEHLNKEHNKAVHTADKSKGEAYKLMLGSVKKNVTQVINERKAKELEKVMVEKKIKAKSVTEFGQALIKKYGHVVETKAQIPDSEKQILEPVTEAERIQIAGTA